jgi:hypothetical protein
MAKKNSDIARILQTYRGMTEAQIQTEVDEISNLIYALLLATDNESIEVYYDRKVIIKMTMTESSDLLN